MKFISLLIFASFYLNMSRAEMTADTALQVGDRVPDNIRLRLLNYSKKTARFSEFHSKLLILDFWNTHCAACYKSFPKIEELQKKFAGRMKVLLVTDETDSTVIKYFAIRKKTKAFIPGAPIVFGDRRLEKLFDHQIEPHEVWINESGLVTAISEAAEITPENILCMLAGGPCKITQKNDFAVSYEIGQPLYKNGNGGSGDKLMYHSVLAHYTMGIPYVTGYHSSLDKPYGDEIFGFLSMNQSIESLYRIAYDKGPLDHGLGQMGVPVKRTILEMKDTSKYVAYIDGKIAIQNCYCYDLVVPVTTNTEVKRQFQEDLKRYFGLRASLEKRTMKCLVLKIRDTSTISAKGDVKPDWNMFDFSIKLVNTPFEKLMFWMTYRYTYPYPLIDETGIKGSVDMDFEGDMSNYQVVAAAIKKYNMDLVVEDRSIEVLVLRDQE